MEHTRDEAALEAAAIAWHGVTYAGAVVRVRWAALGPGMQEGARLRVRRLAAGAPIADEADAVALDVYWAAMAGTSSPTTH